MSFIRLLARGLALLTLLVSTSAWAITQQQVLTAIKNKDANAHEKLAAYAAENNTSVAAVVGELVHNNPRLAGAITAAGVSANPSNSKQIMVTALRALTDIPGLSTDDVISLRLAIVRNAVANAPADSIRGLRSGALQEGMPASAVDEAIRAGKDSRSATATTWQHHSLTGLFMNESTTYAGGGVSSP